MNTKIKHLFAFHILLLVWTPYFSLVFFPLHRFFLFSWFQFQFYVCNENRLFAHCTWIKIEKLLIVWSPEGLFWIILVLCLSCCIRVYGACVVQNNETKIVGFFFLQIYTQFIYSFKNPKWTLRTYGLLLKRHNIFYTYVTDRLYTDIYIYFTVVRMSYIFFHNI